MPTLRPSLRRAPSIAAAVALVVVATAAGGARPAPAAAPAREPTVAPADWLAGVTAPHKQLFDAPTPGGGIPLVHIMNYYDTYNRAFGVKDADVDAVGTFYGATTFYGLDDAMWAKYRLGEFLQTNDEATGRPAVANPWRAAPVILGGAIPQAGIESLQKRGATFILCDNALTIFSGMLAKSRGLDPQVVYADMKAHVLPGVIVVPGMVIAIEQAHAAGLSYHRQ